MTTDKRLYYRIKNQIPSVVMKLAHDRFWYGKGPYEWKFRLMKDAPPDLYQIFMEIGVQRVFVAVNHIELVLEDGGTVILGE